MKHKSRNEHAEDEVLGICTSWDRKFVKDWGTSFVQAEMKASSHRSWMPATVKMQVHALSFQYIRVKPYWPASIIYQVWMFDMGYFDKSRHGRQAPSTVEKVPLPHFPWTKLMQVSLKLWSLNEWRTWKVVDPCRPVSVEMVRWRLKSWSKKKWLDDLCGMKLPQGR